MYTITLQEALHRLSQITKLNNEEYDKIRELIKLTYKSGKHDGWYDAVEQRAEK